MGILLFYFLIGGKLLYYVVLVSALNNANQQQYIEYGLLSEPLRRIYCLVLVPRTKDFYQVTGVF